MKRFFREEAGYTLVEILITTMILVLALGGAYSLFSGGVRSYKIGEARMDVQQNVRTAVAQVAREVKSAKQVRDMQTTIDSVLYSSANSSNLFLQMSDGSVVIYYYYAPAGSSLEQKELRRAVRNFGALSFTGVTAVAYNLSSVQFMYDKTPITASRVITIKIEGSGEDGRKYNLETKSSIRVPTT